MEFGFKDVNKVYIYCVLFNLCVDVDFYFFVENGFKVLVEDWMEVFRFRMILVSIFIKEDLFNCKEVEVFDLDGDLLI